jgi:hypothetical protein
LDQLRLAVPPRGGVSTSTTCCVAVIEVHQPKRLSLDWNFAPRAYLRTDLRRSVQGPVCLCYFPRHYVHASVCAIGQCGVLGFPYGTTHHGHTNKSGLRGERPRGDSRR